MLTNADLAYMRATQEDALPDSCTRERTPMVADGQGGFIAGTPVVVTLPCRKASRGIPDHYMAMQAAQGKQLWMVTFAYGADVRARDVLTIGGVDMTVLGLASGGAWETAVRAVCVEVV